MTVDSEPRGSTEPASLQRSDIWYKTGTIILQTESTQFRVFGGILSLHSPVFKGMIKNARNAQGGEVIEGCCVIRVKDSATDVKHFLKAIHELGYYDHSAKTSFSIIAAVLRLGTKYKVAYLRQQAIQQLMTVFPTTLEDWDKRNSSTRVNYFPARPLEVVNLARIYNIPALLPAALASSCWAGIDGLALGLPSLDDRHVVLSNSDKKICLIARELLLRAQRLQLLGFLLRDITFPADSPLNQGLCTTFNCDSGRIARLRWWDESRGSDNHPFIDVFPWDKFTLDVCPHCLQVSRQSYTAARKALWNDLPSFFGLPSWDRLKNS